MKTFPIDIVRAAQAEQLRRELQEAEAKKLAAQAKTKKARK